MSAIWTLEHAAGQLIERAFRFDGVFSSRFGDGLGHSGWAFARLHSGNIADLDDRVDAAWGGGGILSVDRNGQGSRSKDSTEGLRHEKLMAATSGEGLTGQAAILLALPIAIIAIVAAPLGWLLGSYQWLCAGTGLILTVPAGVMTLLAGKWLNARSPFGDLIATFLGVFVRLAVGVGGGLFLYLMCGDVFKFDRLSYWLWLLAAYLTTLTIEMALLVHIQFQTIRQQKI